MRVLVARTKGRKIYGDHGSANRPVHGRSGSKGNGHDNSKVIVYRISVPYADVEANRHLRFFMGFSQPSFGCVYTFPISLSLYIFANT